MLESLNSRSLVMLEVRRMMLWWNSIGEDVHFLL